ncbi:sulfite exporter TauE/SafE family protein [Aestuariicella hydrocarbonica]|uniref:Probable membrane transporter protein n=1 Tax=Pseudomaricurvus hydrocarbonicus TaxID=1470433 RepID=A0A9E5MJK1_9GAMM|nr:sulfite exporter TauE/SafE family protein [Aestuariicella hydrocarbonica]NHO65259.1 sulfite exporter TauE/SafE family protein [Aestuariicella hydrocarbonica]
MDILILLYILAGAAVGLAVGITGVGGGSLMTPLLILFGFPYHVAIGTDLLYASVTKAGGVISHQRQGHINWSIVRTLAAGSIPAAIATTLLLKSVFANADEYKQILTSSLGVMLLLTSAVLLFKSRIQPKASPHEKKWLQLNSKPLTFVMGIFLGVFVTLSSVGAGAIGTAILLVLYPALQARHIVGTDIAHAVPLTLVGGVGHMIFLGNVDFMLLGCLLIGSLPAVSLGTKIGSRLPNHVLQPILAFILMGLGVKFALF